MNIQFSFKPFFASTDMRWFLSCICFESFLVVWFY